MTNDWLADTRTSYDTVAVSYTDQLRNAIAGAPDLRAALASFADRVRTAGGGPVADIVFDHFHRVLRPGAPLQLGFHVGDSSGLKRTGYGGHPMKVYVHRRQPDQVASWLRAAGFEIKAQWLLDPDERVPQAILFARRVN